MNDADGSASKGGQGLGRRLAGDEGQAIVEAAIVMPAMLFMVLTIIQLTMLQHARIMTEYAAFTAARAGIVYNADKRAMERAAAVALLPTMARTDTLGRVLTQQGRIDGHETIERGAFNLPVVHVDVLHPTAAEFGAMARHLGGAELDFDDIRTQAAMANQLQIRIRYFYRMPIPFANQMLQAIWFAQRMGTLRSWRGMDMTRPEGVGGMSAVREAQQRAMSGLGAHDATERQQMVGVASAANARRYYFPIEATYTMRMQSNVYRRNVQ